MDRKRLLLALVLSMAVLMSWPLIARYFFPQPPRRVPDLQMPVEQSPQPAVEQGSPAQIGSKPPQTSATPTTAVAPREIIIDAPSWRAILSNKGAVATSWIIKKEKTSVGEREIYAAGGGPLELIPQEEELVKKVGRPLSLHLPWSPELAASLNNATFEVQGVEPGRQEIALAPGQQIEIGFLFSSPQVTARKSLRFTGDSFVVDVTAQVTSNGGAQPVEIVLGPRVGDQSERQTGGSYSTPPQVIAYTGNTERESYVSSYITPPFATITAIDHSSNRIQIDKPLAGDVGSVSIVAGDEHLFLARARVIEREANSQMLTLDSLPEGAAIGNGVAQGADTIRGRYSWVGVVDHYFAMLAIPAQPVSEARLFNARMRTPADTTAQDYPAVAVPVRPEAYTHLFVGPKDRELLIAVGSQLGADLEAVLDYGIFAFMIRPLVPAIGWALDGLAKLFHNYGWSIVVVTVIINLALSPLRYFSSKKMKKAAKHQPRMKELQDKMKKFKENPKKYEREMAELQREQLALMKEANPLGGCLPLLLQMPIFWAFFVYLTISLDVRQAPWLFWVNDLSKQDPYYVLPVIMCVTMIASTKLTPQPATADPSMKMQRVMMTYIMPVMLTYFFFFTAPSGLVLYWMVGNIVGVVIQLVINRLTAEPAADPGGITGSGPGKKKQAGSDKPEAGRKSKAREKEAVGGVK